MIIQQPKISASSLGLDKAVFADVVPVVEEVCENYGVTTGILPIRTVNSGIYRIQTYTLITRGNNWYRFTASGTSSANKYIEFSTDKGVTWTQQSVLPYSPECEIIYVESLGKFCYVSDTYFHMSSDCVTWTNTSISSTLGEISSTVSLHWREDIQKFVCISYAGVYEGSADGKTWTQKATFGSSRYTNYYTDAGDYYIGASQYTTSDSGACYVRFIRKSDYNVSLISSSQEAVPCQAMGIVKVINNILIISSEGYLYTWQLTGTNTATFLKSTWFDGLWSDLIYDEGNARYIALAYNGTGSFIYTSTDCKTWTQDTTYTLPEYAANLYLEDGWLYVLGRYAVVRIGDKIVDYNTQLKQGQNGTVFSTLGATGGLKILTGSYVGTGATVVQNINLGIKPKAVYIQQSSPPNPYVYSALIFDGYPQYEKTGIGNYNVAQITNTGFSVGNTSNDSCRVNSESLEYYYIAFV